MTGRECELIRERSFASNELTDRLQPVLEGKDRLVSFIYSPEELDELAGFVAAEANHSQNRKVGKEWDAIFERITELLNDKGSGFAN